MPYKSAERQSTYWRDRSRKRRATGYKNVSHYRNDPQKYLWLGAKYNAKTKKQEFTIIPDDIKIPEFCPLLGVHLTRIFGQGRVDSNISIDRIDSTQGYTPDNIWVISWLANRMKQNASIHQLRSFAAGILINFGDEK